jgi:hypothetical protein
MAGLRAVLLAGQWVGLLLVHGVPTLRHRLPARCPPASPRGEGCDQPSGEAALSAIRSRGGGAVEAYPIETWRAGTAADMSTHGPLAMFERAGFELVAPYGNFNLLMRLRV